VTSFLSFVTELHGLPFVLQSVGGFFRSVQPDYVFRIFFSQLFRSHSLLPQFPQAQRIMPFRQAHALFTRAPNERFASVIFIG
jgi:hypothetical protein